MTQPPRNPGDWGPPAYGPPAYPPPPPYGTPGGPPGPYLPAGPQPPGGGSHRGIIATVIAVLVAAGAVLSYFLLAGDSNASTPKGAVKSLLEAGKKKDVAAARKVLCKGDLDLGITNEINTDSAVASYSIGSTSTNNGVTYVSAIVKSSGDSQARTTQFPTVKEGSAWKVCLSKGLATGLPAPNASSSASVPNGSTTPAPTPTFPTTLPSGLPSIPGGVSICASATTSLGVATTYVAAAEVGFGTFAQSCVLPNTVSPAVTNSLGGKLFAPVTTDPVATSVQFQATDGHTKLTVSTSQRNGKFYVVGVKIG
jgi:hypothetical protein